MNGRLATAMDGVLLAAAAFSRDRPGEAPFPWLSKTAPPSGFGDVSPGGMWLSAFLFVRRDGRILFGKYAEDPRWEALAGLDMERVKVHGRGWTIPARHLKYGEDPRAAARSIGEGILQIRDMRYSEPRVEADLYEPKRSPAGCTTMSGSS